MSTVGVSSLSNGNSPLIIERGKSFTIETAQKGTQYRVQISAFNDLPYVGITKFWFQPELKRWLPTKKNIYMSPVVWRDILVRSHAITQALSSFEKERAGDDFDLANSGTHE